MFEVSDKYFGLNLNRNWRLNLTQNHFWPTKLNFYSKTCIVGIYWLLHQTQKIFLICLPTKKSFMLGGIGIWEKWKCLWKSISHSNILKSTMASIFFQIYLLFKVWECVKIFDDGIISQEHETSIQIFCYWTSISERASIKTDAVILKYKFPFHVAKLNFS